MVTATPMIQGYSDDAGMTFFRVPLLHAGTEGLHYRGAAKCSAQSSGGWQLAGSAKLVAEFGTYCDGAGDYIERHLMCQWRPRLECSPLRMRKNSGKT